MTLHLSENLAQESILNKFDQHCQNLHASIEDSITLLGNPTEQGEDLSIFTNQAKFKLDDFLDREECVPLAKLVLTFSSLCQEVEELRQDAERKFYPFFLCYGQQSDEDDEDEVALKRVSRCLCLLQECSFFLERCYDVVDNIVDQISALYSEKNHVASGVKDLHMSTVFESLMQILAVFIKLDNLIGRNTALKYDWELYLKSLQVAKINMSQVANTGQLKTLESISQKINIQLMSGFIFQNCIRDKVDAKRESTFLEEFSLQIKVLATKTQFQLTKSQFNNNHRCKIIGLTGLLAYYLSINRSNDALKLAKLVIDVGRQVPYFTVFGDILWNPVEFLMENVLSFEECRKQLQNSLDARASVIQELQNSLAKDLTVFTAKVAMWCSEVCSLHFLNEQNLEAELDRRYSLLKEAVYLSSRLSYFVTCLCTSRLVPQDHQPIEPLCSNNQQIIDFLFKGVALLKIVELTYCKQWIVLSNSACQINQKLLASLLSKVDALKEKFSSTSSKAKSADTLALIELAESCLSFPTSRQSEFAFKLCLDLLASTKKVKSEEISELLSLFDRTIALESINYSLKCYFDCSFFYFHQKLIQIYFKRYLQLIDEGRNLQAFFVVLNDIVHLLEKSEPTKQEQVEKYVAQTKEMLDKEFLEKVAEIVENDLRLSYHTHLKLDERNPFLERSTSLRDAPCVFLRRLLALPPLRLHNTFIDLKRFVEKHLERNFYNLTTVALHDWKTYAEMRQLASRKFRLSPVDPSLPSQTLDQGLDTLELMRNLNLFAANFRYNLNDQVFVEVASNNKYLNTLNIKHITNSIRTHGIGVINTTVNYTYQYLRKKFYVFSQFLYDDHIKSRLTKDARFFRESKDQLNGIFPFERAEKFSRSVRKLGTSADGSSYLDQFGLLITHIGNALGYVRLVKAGALRSCAESVQFLHSEDQYADDASAVALGDFFADGAQEAPPLASESVARSFDDLVADMVKSFTTTTEYFKLLVDVFAGEFRSAKHIHLKNFYVAVPALTVSYVEHIIQCKERLGKKSVDNAAVSDDGFAMGLAYILKLLDQYNEFDSLQWFKSVKEKYGKDKAEASQTGNRSKSLSVDGEKLQQTLNLTKRRILQYSQEFELVHFALRSARIFFRADVLQEPLTKDGTDTVGEKTDSERSFASKS